MAKVKDSDNSNGSKATIREVIDLIIPIKESIARIETKLDDTINDQKENFKLNCDNYIKCSTQNREEHKELMKMIHSKISIKSFISWLSGAVAFFTLLSFLLRFFGIML